MTSLLDTLTEYRALRSRWIYDRARETWHCGDWTISLVLSGLSGAGGGDWSGYQLDRAGATTGPVHPTLMAAMRAAGAAS